MQKVAAIGLDTIKENLISELMDLGVVEVTNQAQKLVELEEWQGLAEKDGNEIKATALDAELNRVSLALETLEKHSTAKAPLFSTRRSVVREDYDKVLEDREAIYGEMELVLALNEELNRNREEINKRTSDLASLKPWLVYDAPLDELRTGKTSIALGILPTTVVLEDIKASVTEISEASELIEVGRDKDLIYVVVISMTEDQEDVQAALKQRGFTPVPLEGMKGTALENEERIIKEIAELEAHGKEIEKRIDDKYDSKERIECLHDQIAMERDHEKVKEKFVKTKKTFNFEGWVPEPAMESVKAVLENNGCAYKFREPLEDETVPVLVQNNSAVQPFEAITEMYSLPDYRGIDPTKIFAFFYAMFFGIMLSDAGYGLVITIATFIILKKFDLEGMMGKMIKMFFFCGISTVFWGGMFGGWFGDAIPKIGEVFFGAEINIDPWWFNPIEDPTRLLIWSLIFGVVHLFLGMGINAYMLIKRGHLFDAICDVFSWYFVILGAVLFVCADMIGMGFLSTPGLVMALIGVAILLFTGGRHNKGIGKVTGGLSSLYDVTSYISDILSYSRLLALGLATGVIAQVVNTMGTLGGKTVVGVIVFVIVFAVGHVFNMAINALGAFVHSSRLQYIEFFGKFYEDGGDEFKPLKKDTKYVKLTRSVKGGK